LKIIYILDWKFGSQTGVAKKVLQQISFWTKSGLNAELWVMTSSPNSWLKEPKVTKLFTYRNIWERGRLRTSIYRELDPSVHLVYFRIGFFTPFQIIKLLKVRFVIEVNTLDKFELRFRNIFLRIYRKVTDRIIYTNASAVFCVTNEILANVKKDYKVNQNIYCVPNSTKLSKNLRQHNTVNRKPRLIFVGSAGIPWHGLQRIILLAEIFTEYEFFLIGVSLSNPIPKNIKLFGELTGRRLQEIIKQSDVGLSTLGLDFKQMKEACPLKSREYLSYGLPIISGYIDPAFPRGANFIFRIDFTKDVNWEKISRDISKFIKKWMGKKVNPSQLRNIDIVNVERKRVEVLRNVLKRV
jgi:hypothetical protein